MGGSWRELPGSDLMAHLHTPAVNYGGSSGYGRAFRKRLQGTWGVVDVDDCCNAARHLAKQVSGETGAGRLLGDGSSFTEAEQPASSRLLSWPARLLFLAHKPCKHLPLCYRNAAGPG